MSPVVHVPRLRRLRHTVGYCTSHTEFNQLTEINLSVWKNHHGQGDGVLTLLYMTIETVNAEH